MARVLAIGDIHGCARALEALVNELAPRSDDLLITLGDYIDRGPDSKRVVEFLISLAKGNRVVSLRGNHEMLWRVASLSDQARLDWLSVGGGDTLASYGLPIHSGGTSP